MTWFVRDERSMLTVSSHTFQQKLDSMSKEPMMDRFFSDLNTSVPRRLGGC